MQNKTDKGTLLVSKSLSVANPNSVCRLFSARMNKYYVSIRELRLYINDYLSGEIEDTELDEYRENIKGKFVIVNIVPFVMGGAQIYVCFMDCPSKVFSLGCIALWTKRTKSFLNISAREFRMLAKKLVTRKRRFAES